MVDFLRGGGYTPNIMPPALAGLPMGLQLLLNLFYSAGIGGMGGPGANIAQGAGMGVPMGDMLIAQSMRDYQQHMGQVNQKALQAALTPRFGDRASAIASIAGQMSMPLSIAAAMSPTVAATLGYIPGMESLAIGGAMAQTLGGFSGYSAFAPTGQIAKQLSDKIAGIQGLTAVQGAGMVSILSRSGMLSGDIGKLRDPRQSAQELDRIATQLESYKGVFKSLGRIFGPGKAAEELYQTFNQATGGGFTSAVRPDLIQGIVNTMRSAQFAGLRPDMMVGLATQGANAAAQLGLMPYIGSKAIMESYTMGQMATAGRTFMRPGQLTPDEMTSDITRDVLLGRASIVSTRAGNAISMMREMAVANNIKGAETMTPLQLATKLNMSAAMVNAFAGLEQGSLAGFINPDMLVSGFGQMGMSPNTIQTRLHVSSKAGQAEAERYISSATLLRGQLMQDAKAGYAGLANAFQNATGRVWSVEDVTSAVNQLVTSGAQSPAEVARVLSSLGVGTEGGRAEVMSALHNAFSVNGNDFYTTLERYKGAKRAETFNAAIAPLLEAEAALGLNVSDLGSNIAASLLSSNKATVTSTIKGIISGPQGDKLVQTFTKVGTFSEELKKRLETGAPLTAAEQAEWAKRRQELVAEVGGLSKLTPEQTDKLTAAFQVGEDSDTGKDLAAVLKDLDIEAEEVTIKTGNLSIPRFSKEVHTEVYTDGYTGERKGDAKSDVKVHG
jgi:hypothetical protein